MDERNIKGYIINESPSVMMQPEIVSENKCNRVIIRATLQDADARNRNKRIYPKDVLDKGLHAPYVQERIRTKTFYGEAGHPLKPDIQRQLYMDQSNISHIVNSFWWEGNTLKGYVEAANTARGNDFDGLVRQGCKVGFSLRAVGPITEKRGDTVTVKDPLTIFSYDWVIHPSHASAYMDSIISEGASPIITNLCESFNPIFEPIYEDVTNYFIESSKNLNIIAESMGINVGKKIVGKDILVTEDAKSIIIRDEYDTFVINSEDYLSNEISSYMSKLNLKSESTDIEYFDMHNNNYDKELNEDMAARFDAASKRLNRQVKMGNAAAGAMAVTGGMMVAKKIKNKIDENKQKKMIQPGVVTEDAIRDEYFDMGENLSEEVNILEQDKKLLKKEAERLFSAIESKLTPALKQCKDAEGADKFRRWCGYDYSSSKKATLSVCIFSCQRLYNKLRDDYDDFVKKVEKEAITLVNRLKSMTKHKLYLEEDDGNYFIMLEKNNNVSESVELNEENPLAKLGKKQANSKAGQFGIKIGKKIVKSTSKADTDTELKEDYTDGEYSESDEMLNELFGFGKKTVDDRNKQHMKKVAKVQKTLKKQQKNVENINKQHKKNVVKLQKSIKKRSKKHKVNVRKFGSSEDINYGTTSEPQSQATPQPKVDKNSEKPTNQESNTSQPQQSSTQQQSDTTKTEPVKNPPLNGKRKLNIGEKIAGMSKGKKIAAGIALGGAAAAGGYALYKHFKDKDRKKLEECTIDVLYDESGFTILEEDMDFLLEACDYALSEEEIMDNIEDHLLSEGLFDGLTRRKLRKTEDKLARARRERKEMDEKYKNRDTVRVSEPITTASNSYDFASGGIRTTYSTEYQYVYKSVKDVKADKDDEIRGLEREVRRLKAKLGEKLDESTEIISEYSASDAGAAMGRLGREIKLAPGKTALSAAVVAGGGYAIKKHIEGMKNKKNKKQIKEEVSESYELYDEGLKEWKEKREDRKIEKMKKQFERLEKQPELIKKMYRHRKGIAAGAILTAVAGGALYKLYKDKEKELKESVIDILIEEDSFTVFDTDIEFLAEVFDYQLSEEEIMDCIEEVLLDEGFFFNRGRGDARKLERQQEEEQRKQDWNDRVAESNRLRKSFTNKIPNELKPFSRGKMFGADIFVFEIPYEKIDDGSDKELYKKFNELKAEIQKATKYKVNEGSEDNNIIIDLSESTIFKEDFGLNENFLNMFKKKDPKEIEEENARATVQADKKTLVGEAKRLFPVVTANLTTNLLKAKNESGDTDFRYYNGLDLSNKNKTAICVCLFDFDQFKDSMTDYKRGDFGKYEKMLKTAEAEAERLINVLNGKTSHKVSLHKDGGRFHIILTKGSGKEELTEAFLFKKAQRPVDNFQDCQKEANRLLPKVKSMFGPALKTGLKNTPKSWQAIGDRAGKGATIISISFQELRDDNDPEFDKLYNKANEEANNIVRLLRNDNNGFRIDCFSDEYCINFVVEKITK